MFSSVSLALYSNEAHVICAQLIGLTSGLFIFRFVSSRNVLETTPRVRTAVDGAGKSFVWMNKKDALPL